VVVTLSQAVLEYGLAISESEPDTRRYLRFVEMDGEQLNVFCDGKCELTFTVRRMHAVPGDKQQED
jgi:hypothetical protein